MNLSPIATVLAAPKSKRESLIAFLMQDGKITANKLSSEVLQTTFAGDDVDTIREIIYAGPLAKYAECLCWSLDDIIAFLYLSLEMADHIERHLGELTHEAEMIRTGIRILREHPTLDASGCPAAMALQVLASDRFNLHTKRFYVDKAKEFYAGEAK